MIHIKNLPILMSFMNIIIFPNLPARSKTCVFRHTVPTSPDGIPVIRPIVPVYPNSGTFFEILPYVDIHVAEVVMFRILDAISLFCHDKVREFSPCTTTSASKIRRESEDTFQNTIQSKYNSIKTKTPIQFSVGALLYLRIYFSNPKKINLEQFLSFVDNFKCMHSSIN